ncbi:MAG: HEAT repeat domain-containing protein [Desulfuromonadales bacterium]|nr:HEAT repeat domain-containing protein [Desulfuromonadales bacterium]
MKRLLTLLLLSLLISACQNQRTLDLDTLARQARGGDVSAGRELVRLFATATPEVNDRLYRIVIESGDAVIEPLLENIKSRHPEQMERVIAALGTLKVVRAVPTIAEVLADTAYKRRYVAAWALGEIGAPDGIPALIRALDDDVMQVRRYATRSLVKFNQGAVDPLIAALDTSSERSTAAIIRALGDIGDKRSLDPLLRHVSGPVRNEAFLALGKLRDSRAEQALIQGLSDTEWQVRMNAAMALGSLGTSLSAAPLRLSLEDEVMVVREWSARSLSTITGHAVNYRDASGEMVAPYTVYH